MNFLIIGIGGFLGAISRYLVYVGISTLSSSIFPYATLAVNSAGCFLIGLLSTSLQSNSTALLFLGTGFLGAFTTFSTFGLETLELIKQGQYFFVFVSVFANLLIGIFGVFLGKFIAGF